MIMLLNHIRISITIRSHTGRFFMRERIIMKKMDFEEFKKWAAEEVKSRLPEKYADVTPSFEQIKKHSSSYAGMVMRAENETCASVVNMDEIYDRYLKGDPPEKLLDAMAEIIMVRNPFKPDFAKEVTNYEKVKDKLYIRVTNAEDAQGRFSNCPHTIHGEFLISYNVRFKCGENNFASILIDNNMLEIYGITEDELRRDAMENAEKIFEPRYNTLAEIAEEGFEDILPECMADMVLISDQYSRAGSAVLFYPGILDRIAEKTGGDFYLYPYSEICSLAFPKRHLENFGEYQRFVTATYSPDSDGRLLSTNLYYYDAENHVMTEYETIFNGKGNEPC